VGSEDFKSFCRALITFGVGSIPTRSRQHRPGRGGWIGLVASGLAAAVLAFDPLSAGAVDHPGEAGDWFAAVPADSGLAAPAIVPIDSLGRAFDAADSLAVDSLATGSSGIVGTPPAPRRIERPPSVAWTTIRSGLVPGWGQLVNRKPVKAGLFFGAWTLFGIQAIAAEADRRDAQEAFDMSGAASDMEAVNDAVDRRNARFWWMGGVAVFSMLDAYVDVHFWGFEEQWQARLAPTAEGGGRLTLGVRFR
jgi:hypothetical protein